MGYDIDDARMRANITTWVPGTNIWHFQRVRATDLFQPLPEGMRGAWYALAEDAQVPQTVALLVSCYDDGHWEVNADLTTASLPHTSKTQHTCLTALKEQLARKPEERVLWHSVRDRDLPSFAEAALPRTFPSSCQRWERRTISPGLSTSPRLLTVTYPLSDLYVSTRCLTGINFYYICMDCQSSLV